MKRSPMPSRRSRLSRVSGPKRKSAPKRKRRDPEEFARIYGSKERVRWVKSLTCCVPWCSRKPCENAHAKGDGMGRKGHYTPIAPMCPKHHREMHDEGCIEYVPANTRMVIVFAREHHEHAAAYTEAAWQRECARRAARGEAK